jgi:Myb-like DNA-binding domain
MERVALPPPMLWQQQQQQQQLQQHFFYHQAAIAFQQQQWHMHMQQRMWHARAPPPYAPQARASITELEDSSEEQTDAEFESDRSRAASDQSCCTDDNDEELPAAAAAAVAVCVAAAHPPPIAPPAVGKIPLPQAVCWPYGHFASLAGFHELIRQQAVLQQQQGAHSNAPRPVLVQQPQHQQQQHQQQQQPSRVTSAAQVCERTTGTAFAALEADEVLSTSNTSTSSSSSNNKRCERWSQDEHEQFIRALELHGRDWKLIKATLPTRTLTQVHHEITCICYTLLHNAACISACCKSYTHLILLHHMHAATDLSTGPHTWLLVSEARQPHTAAAAATAAASDHSYR